jgi:virginiamycin B lyase
MRSLASLLVAPIILSATLSIDGLAQQTVEVREWTVPWADSRPRDPYVDSKGRVWFVGQTADYVAMLDPETGQFTKYDLDKGAGPHNLIVDNNGIVWYAGNRAMHIGRLDPATKAIQKIMMPDSGARDPHTLVFDSKGDIWFTVQGGGYVGKLTVADGSVKLVKIPGSGTRPYGIVVDPQGQPWFNEFGTNKIGTIDPETMELREYDRPAASGRSRRIGVTSDDRIWYVDYARGMLGVLDPTTGSAREWQTPGGSGSRPYAMAVDDKDRLWFVETGVHPNRFIGFDPKTSEFFSITTFGGNRNTVRHMVFHRSTREIWFGTDAGTIGRARVP